jgi:hypothetical protein
VVVGWGGEAVELCGKVGVGNLECVEVEAWRGELDKSRWYLTRG